MINNGTPAGGGQRSNTGYIGSYQHALAIEADNVAQQHRLRQQSAMAADGAFVDGHQQGFGLGHQHGWNEGWTAAAEQANGEMEKQLAYTREHIEDKERLKAELSKQAQTINALEARVNALEEENRRLRQENGLLRKADTSLRELIGSLRSANESLQQQVKELDANYQARTQQYAEQIWQYNRAMVFVSAVGGVLEELTRENTPNAQHARDLFAEKYAQEVGKGLKQGTIKMAPDIDPAFSRYLPKTQQLIADLLVLAKDGKPEDPAPEP